MSAELKHRPTWAETDLENLAYNFRSIRRFVGEEVLFMAVVKADAYGHGAVACARRLEREGVDWFGVALPEEGVELRNAGIRKLILSLGGFWPGQERLLLDNQITPVIFHPEKARLFDAEAASRGTVADIHVKIDTGMGRVGLRPEEVAGFIEGLRECRHLRVAGLMTHFAAADDLGEADFTHRQIALFDEARARFADAGFRPAYFDLANSPGAVVYPESRANLVRIGGILYGLGDDVLPSGVERPDIRPVLSLKTRIAHLKRVPSGESLGYSRTFVTRRDSMIATLPIGYRDGLPRSVSNRSFVLVRGRRAPLVGRVSMDWTIIDVTDIPDARIGDETVIIGESGYERRTAEDLAREAGTISYEITCGISGRVVRKFRGD